MRVFEERPDKPLIIDEQSIINNAAHVYYTFLAGSIDMGDSIDWQSEYVAELESIAIDVTSYRIDDAKENNSEYNPDADILVIYNPRRITAPKDLEAQINWELDRLESCDSIYMNILGNSKSPISLLELGLYAKSGKLKVTCPKEFYRYDNVRVTCERYNVPLRNNKTEMF